MKKVFLILAAAATMVAAPAFTSVAQAALATSMLTMGQVNHLQDYDYEAAFTAPGVEVPSSGTLAVNDVLEGVFTVLSVETPPLSFLEKTPAPDTFMAVFAIQIEAITPQANGSYNLTMGAAPAAYFAALGLTQSNANSAVFMYSTNPASLNVTSGNLNTDLESVISGNPLWQFGFSTAAAPGTTTSWTANVSALTLDVTTLKSVEYAATLDVTQTYSAGVPLSSFTSQVSPLTGLPLPLAQLELVGGYRTTGGVGDFEVPTATDLYMAPVPEPSAMVALASMMVLVGAVGSLRQLRRRST